MISKQQLVNILFVSSFAFNGIGKYVAKVLNFSVGNMVSITPLLMILILYSTDVFIKRGFYIQLTRNYILLLLFVCCTIVFSFLEALQIGHPGFNGVNTFFLALFVIAISHATLVVMFYNTENKDFNLARLIYFGFSIDILVNLIGYAVGFQNVIHHIPGRLNLPFSQGFYATANSVAIINLLILGMWRFENIKPPFKILTVIHFSINLILMIGFNSRLSIMIFILCVILVLFRVINFYKTIFAISIFTIPLMISFASLIYNILQLPILNKIIRRLDYEDVTSFNGRRDLWEKGIDWLSSGGQGYLTGNGYQGHYTLGLLDDLVEFWNRTSAIGLHMHSSMLEYLLAQGILGTLPLVALIFLSLRYYAKHQSGNSSNGILLGVLIYMLFIFQIDIYAYITNSGAFLLFVLVSSVLVRRNYYSVKTKYHKTYEDQHHHAIV
jgi:O-antigen ligase